MIERTEDKLVSLLAELVGHETVNPPGKEQTLADYLTNRLEASPVDFDIGTHKIQPDRSNVIARAGDQSKGSLLLAGHMDVVPAISEDWSGYPFELRREGDRLVGRGTADMKGALAAKLTAAEAFLTKYDDAGEVILAFLIDEEVGSSGAKALVESGIETDAAIIGEPTQLQIAIAEYGAVGCHLTVSGESGHSGRPDRTVNAIDGLRRVLDQIGRFDEQVQRQEHELFTPGPSVNITEIEAGIGPNVIPDRASATIDWRILPDPGRKQIDCERQLTETIGSPTLDGEPVDFEIECEFFSTGFESDVDNPIVQATLDSAREAGIDSECTGFNAGSDARFFARAGIPTLLFGPGSVEDDAHSINESVSVDALKEATEVYYGVLTRFLRDG